MINFFKKKHEKEINLTDKFDNLNNLYSLVNNDTKIKEWVSKTYK